MTSTSSGGGSIITLEFNLNESIDIAQQDVQAAINAGYSYLPKDLPNPPIYSKVNPADAPILTLALTSDTMELSKVEDLADTILAQKISQLSGVGLVSIAGGQKPAVRIQANPTALAGYGLSLEDIRTALGTANVDQAKGNLNGSRQALHDRRQRPAAFERRLRQRHHRLSQRLSGALVRRRQLRRLRGKPVSGRVDGHAARSQPSPPRARSSPRRTPS